MHDSLYLAIPDTSEKKELIDFFIANFNLNEAQWNWKYQNFTKGDIVIARDKGDNAIAGFYAVLPWNLKEGKKVLEASQSVNTLTLSNYRRKGIFTAIGSETLVQQKNKNIKMVWGFTDYKGGAMKGFKNKIGWQEVSRLVDLYYPLNIYKSTKMKFSNPYTSFLLSFPLFLYKSFKIISNLFKNEIKDVEVKRGEWDEEGFVKCWERIAQKNNWHIFRNADYFGWRYISHPENKYFPISIYKDGNCLGYIIVVTYNGDIGNIAEIMTKDSNKKVIYALIKEAIQFFKERQISSIRYRLSQRDLIYSTFINAGFISTSSNQSLILFPHDANIDNSYMNITNWYLTLGDSDHI